MMVRAESPVQKSLACDIAAILEEKDPLTDDTSADLCLRISLLRTARRQHRLGRWSRIAQIAEEYRNMIKATECNDDICPEDAGCLVATAYPERVAKAIDSIGHFRLASGVNVQIDNGSNLASYDWLAVAALNASENAEGCFSPHRCGQRTSRHDNANEFSGILETAVWRCCANAQSGC